MGNEKYVNYYIEVLTNTVSDCVIRNVSMQANAKITDDVIKEQTEKIDQITKKVKELEILNTKLKEDGLTNENNIINDLKNKLNDMSEELTRQSNIINELNVKIRDYELVKNQATHVETFKNELIKARDEIVNNRNEYEKKLNALNVQRQKEIENLIEKYDVEKNTLSQTIVDLNTKIDYLQLSPAKRKKIDEANKGASTATVIETVIADDNVIKDGGMF